MDILSKKKRPQMDMEEDMEEFKSGFVTLIGRTNVGKSTLINLLVGEKVAAIANKVQTTRTAIKGIVNRKNSQIILYVSQNISKNKNRTKATWLNFALLV